MAKEAACVLGTGVNPGLMDLLPIALTAICREVKKVTVMRHQDASHRRLPFQQKIGAGLTPEQFAAKVQDGSLRHVGLTESMHMIASRFGWTLDSTEDVIEPVIAAREVRSEEITVRPGLAAGVQQYGRGYVNGEERILLDFRATLGEEEPHDTILIKGTPPLRSTIAGGVNGDVATCAILTNAILIVLTAVSASTLMADIRRCRGVRSVGMTLGPRTPRGDSRDPSVGETQVIKLFRDWVAADTVEQEQRNARAVHAAGPGPRDR
jgi:4-hydroxy-tetrahydrodipicolinate reductase